MSEEKKEGLGGWLILVGLEIVIEPVRIVIVLFSSYLEMIKNGSWEVLTTVGTEVYSPLWAPIIIGGISINIVLAIAWLFVAFLFFAKKKVFPKWYIGIMLVSLAFMFLDGIATQLVMPNEPVFGSEIIPALIGALIWIPYMLISRRVKATFIN